MHSIWTISTEKRTVEILSHSLVAFLPPATIIQIYKHRGFMSTNSRLGLRLEDGSILSVYHHWDGYPEWLGVTLNQQYNTREKIAELIDGGDMSSCYSDNEYDYEKQEFVKRDPRPEYYPDCGEKRQDVVTKITKDSEECIAHADNCCGSIAYIFEPNNAWVCYAAEYWNPVTKTHNDTFETVKNEIPSDYPSDIAA